MAKFEVGKTYYTHSICDSECVITGKVLKRTASTVTMEVKGHGTKTLRISKASAFFGAETVKPWGSYSMCPHLTADRVLAA